jgi:DNA-binding response OmpR family regulator
MSACPCCGQGLPDDLWRYDIASAQLLIAGQAIYFSAKQAVIIGLLLKHFGKPVHRDTLIMGMYDDGDEPEDALNNLDVNLCHIRRKLRPTPMIVRNHHRFGYSIVLREGTWPTRPTAARSMSSAAFPSAASSTSS